MSKHRRMNGEGTVTCLSDGRWQMRAPASIDPKRRSFTGEDRDDVRRRYEDYVSGLRRGVDRDAYSQTVGDYLDRWLRIKKPEVKPNTLRGYEQHVRLHIKPSLGHVKVTSLRPSDVRALMADVLDKGLSKTTANRVRATLSAALEDARKDRVIPTNPAKDADAYESDRDDPTSFSDEEVADILEAAKYHPDGPQVAFALWTGLRAGELRGLRWQDVDLDAGTYTVRQTHYRHGADTPKTNESRKPTELAPQALRALESQRGRIDRWRERAGDRWQEHGLVFPSRVGTPDGPSNQLRKLRDLLDTAGVQWRRADRQHRGWHEFRRTFVRLLRDKGVGADDVQRLGRWTQLDTMNKHYNNVHSGRRTKALSLFAEVEEELASA